MKLFFLYLFYFYFSSGTLHINIILYKFTYNSRYSVKLFIFSLFFLFFFYSFDLLMWNFDHQVLSGSQHAVSSSFKKYLKWCHLFCLFVRLVETGSRLFKSHACLDVTTLKRLVSNLKLSSSFSLSSSRISDISHHDEFN